MDVQDLHAKKKGSLGEATVAADIIRRGYPVFREFGDLSRVDMLVEIGPGAFVKVQVKCFRSRNGAVVVDRQKSGPGYRFRYRLEDVDLFTVYVYDRDVILYIPASVICGERRKTTFRFDPPRNGQEALIRHASDYEDFKGAIREIGHQPP